jgi:Fic family protein
MHEQFEAIHPFLDGNGRVGRLLITLFLVDRGRLSQPLLYLSDYIEAHRQGYYDVLQRVRTEGDWSGWLYFFLAGVEETSRAAVARRAVSWTCARPIASA